MNVSTLRNICGQQGQVDQFQENRSQGSVLVTFHYPEEASKALQVISSTMPGIIAELVSPSDSFSTPSTTSSSGWPQGGGSKFGNGAIPSSSASASGGKDDTTSKQSWNQGLPAMPGSQLWSPGPSGPMGWSSLDGDGPSGSFSFLPGDLLGEGTNWVLRNKEELCTPMTGVLHECWHSLWCYLMPFDTCEHTHTHNTYTYTPVHWHETTTTKCILICMHVFCIRMSMYVHSSSSIRCMHK